MPSPPSFDYYAELQVESSASLTEINSAYRRLARIHHPDKNPDNQEEATTIFQRLQLAHETLSDPDKRERYDNGDLWNDEDGPFGSTPFPFPFFFEMFVASRLFRGQRRRDFSQAQAAYDNLQAERERRRQDIKRRAEEAKIMREREQRQRQEAEEARREAAERSEVLAKRRLRDKELMKQEKRWKEKDAVSKDEMVLTCLHSELCDKVQHTKKFKCTACKVKRGMIAFECPHCSAFLCQLCVTDFSERRKKLDMQEQMKEPETTKDSAGASGKPTTNTPDADKPTTGKPTTKKPKNKKPKTDKSAKQTSEESSSFKNVNSKENNVERDPGLSKAGEDKAAPASAGKFASDNPYEILANDEKATPPFKKSVQDVSTFGPTAIPLSTGHPDGAKVDVEKPAPAKLAPLKKRQNKKAADKNSVKENFKPHDHDQQANTAVSVEPNATGVIHHNHRQTLAPDSSKSPFQNMAAHLVSKNIKNETGTPVSIKPQEPMHDGAPSLQDKPKGQGQGPTAGATAGYIRALKPACGLTMADLRQAMEKFGPVTSLRIINKRNGTAHVYFGAHDSLRRVIAASPVVVSEQVTVRVVEYKYCDTCGKTGHFAWTCRAANSSG